MHDVRDAFRALIATPVVTAVAVLSLALGIGANTAIFSILDALVLKTIPVKEPERLTTLSETSSTSVRSWTNPIWEGLRDRQQPFDGAFAMSSTRFNLAQGGQTNFVDGLWTSGAYFDVLGVQAMLGRTFSEADDRRGGGPDGPVAVISYGFWQRHFGGAADVIGKALNVERVNYTIVGVTPPDFFGTEVGRKFDVVIPLGTEPLVRGRESMLDRRSTWWLTIMVRLKPGQSIEQATTAVRGIQPQIRDATMPEQYREEDKPKYLKDPFTLIPAATGTSSLRRRYEQPLTAIMWVVVLVLLIACANIANLLLARATARRHELSVRVALGASRTRILRQLLAESLLLSLSGAVLGLVLAQWGSRMLVRQLSTSTNTVFLDLGIDWRMLGFTALVATGTALLFGIIPALRASRVQPNDALKEQGRAIAGERRFGLGNLLVVWQVALSLILIVAAGLFVRTFASLANMDLGFERKGLLLANVNAQRLQTDPADRPALFRRIHDAASSIAGIQSTALSAVTPISGSTWQFGLEAIDGTPLDTNPDKRSAFVNLISQDWFRTYGITMIGGRDFNSGDTSSSPAVAIVNEAFARKFLGGQNPIGHRARQMGFPGNPAVEREIVGFVKDATYRSLREPMQPTMYLPYTQQPDPPPAISVTVKAAGGSPAVLTKPLTDAFAGIHKDLAITYRVIEDQVNASLIQERVVAMLSGFFGALALVLAGLGLYGVTAYAVSRRRTEIGIRMALGAAPAGVVRMVLGRVALLVGAGIIVGAIASLAVANRVETLLFGLKPRDPVTLIVAAGILAMIGALAGWIPAMRASRIDPARVLRDG